MPLTLKSVSRPKISYLETITVKRGLAQSFMHLGFPSGQSVHCCIQHTPDMPRHIPHPLWLKVISNSISFFLQTHTHTHTHRFRFLPLPRLLTLQHQYRWRPTNFPIQIFGKRLRITRMCVCVCVCGGVQGERFSINGLKRGWKEGNAKRSRKVIGAGEVWGVKTNWRCVCVCRIC